MPVEVLAMIPASSHVLFLFKKTLLMSYRFSAVSCFLLVFFHRPAACLLCDNAEETVRKLQLTVCSD